MNKLNVYLIGVAATVGLFLGGLVIGDVLRDDDPATSSTGADTVEIAAATLAEPDSDPDGPTSVLLPRSSAHHLPAHLFTEDGDGGLRFVGTEPATAQVADGPVATTDGTGPGNTTDSGPSGPGSNAEGDPPDSGPSDPGPSEPGTITEAEPYRPPTVPGGLAEDGTGEADPDAPYEVADWAEELTAEDLFADAVEDVPALADPLFRDPCADPEADPSPSSTDDTAPATEDVGSECPGGMGGTILLIDDGAPPDPLDIMGQFYVSASFDIRCPDLGSSLDYTFRAMFPSNNPASFTIRYWPSGTPSDVREVTYRTSDEELDLWVDRRLTTNTTYADALSGVHNCPELELPDPFPTNNHFTFEIEGVDDFGSRDSVVVYTNIARPEAQLGRPPMNFSLHRREARRGFVTLPYDPSTETAYIASIPKTGDRASDQTCTDLEPAILSGRHYTDRSLGRFGTAVMARAPGDPAFDPRFSLAATAEMIAGEGETYLLCGWAATPAARSFDLPTVVYRESITVRAPRELRVRVSVAGGRSDVPLEAHSVRVRPLNWSTSFGDRFPRTSTGAGPFRLDEPVLVFESQGLPVPAKTVIEVTGPTGVTQLLEVPTPTRCLDYSFITSCPEPRVEHYDVGIPGVQTGRRTCSGGLFGSCDPPEGTYSGNLRLRVERFAGPGGAPSGGPSDGWVIDRSGAFAGNRGERPAIPQVDTNASYLREYRPNPTVRPGLFARLDFDRPVRIEVTPWANFEAPCVEPETYTVDEYRSSHAFRWDELCYGGTYSLSVLAVDEDGNEFDWRTVVDGTPTGLPGWDYIELSKVQISEFTIDVDIHRLGDGIYPNDLELRLGGVPVRPFAGSGVRCRPERMPTIELSTTVRNHGGRPIRWGDAVGLGLEVHGTGDEVGCGLEERFVRVELFEQLWLDDLLSAPEHTFVYDEEDAEITITVRDIRRA